MDHHKQVFSHLAENNARLLTTTFVLVETIALLQRRVGLPPVYEFHKNIMPLLDVVWTDQRWYQKAFQRLHMINRRDVSLVDCLSFEVMDAHEIETALAFDADFEQQGYRLAGTSGATDSECQS